MTRVRRDKDGCYVQTNLLLRPVGIDLVYGLGSKYFRDREGLDDERVSDRPDDLPDSLTQYKILGIYREELYLWGKYGLGTWCDQFGCDRQEYVMKWLTELVLNVFPELEGTA